MRGFAEIRWHGRCGHGTATAARIAAGAAARLGKSFQAFPAFVDDAPPRLGEPVVAYTRIGDEPIGVRSEVVQPFVVVVLDASLLGCCDVTHGAQHGGIVLVNTALTPAGLRERYPLDGLRLCCVDATRVASETTGSAYPNTPMLGALCRATGLMTVESVVEYLRDDFGRRFPTEVVEANVAAVRRGYREAATDGGPARRRASRALSAAAG